jgi:hypothetical protein
LPALAAALFLAGCVGPSEPPPPQPVAVPPSFDRSFDAARAAATDVGVQVLSADRNAGRITGTKDGVEVKIDVLRQPDGKLNVEFTATGHPETNPPLSDRWASAYRRRMGR